MQSSGTSARLCTPAFVELLDIAKRAIAYHDADQDVRSARDDFFDACEVGKAEMGLNEYIVHGTPAWEMLKEKTAVERAALQRAKCVRHNASRRLQTAIRRFRSAGAAAKEVL